MSQVKVWKVVKNVRGLDSWLSDFWLKLVGIRFNLDRWDELSCWRPEPAWCCWDLHLEVLVWPQWPREFLLDQVSICQSCLEILCERQKCDERSWCYTKVELDGEREEAVGLMRSEFSYRTFLQNLKDIEVLRCWKRVTKVMNVTKYLISCESGEKEIKSPLPLWHLSRSAGDVMRAKLQVMRAEPQVMRAELQVMRCLL